MSRRFSVLVPVFNRPKLVRETIDSVLAQTFTDYELVLIDDGSTDETPDVLKSYGDRIKIIRQVNQGPEAARHRAVSLTDGEYFVLLDSDDLLLPHSLATYDRIIRLLDAPPVIIGAMASYQTGDALPGDGNNGVLEVYSYADLFDRDRPLGTTCSQIVAKRSAVETAGAFRPAATAFPFDTADILLSLSAQGPWVAVKAPVTVAYRLHASNTIGNLAYMLRTALCLIQLERKGSYPGGGARRFSRWAYLGGVLWNWCRSALAVRQFAPAARLLFQGSPMIACGVLRKLALKFRRPRKTIRLTDLVPAIAVGIAASTEAPEACLCIFVQMLL
jgi:glycosyltransferase involved in cell wall biosynthesis